MFEKKRWFDGLHDIYEGKDEFEIKLGLFGGDGGDTGGGSGTRGQVGLTRAEQNARADAQEPVRGGRIGGRGFASAAAKEMQDRIGSSIDDSTARDEEQGIFNNDFVTSTEGAYRDLDRRADIGQLDMGLSPMMQAVMPGGAVIGAANMLGKYNAQNMRDQLLNKGGSPVYDDMGRIQGVAHEGTGPLSNFMRGLDLNTNVYSGNYGYQPQNLGIASLANEYRPARNAPVAMGNLNTTGKFNENLMMDALMQGVNNPQPAVTNPMNDPNSQAGIRELFTETIPGALGSAYDYAMGAPSAQAGSYFESRGPKDVQQLYSGQGPDRSFLANLRNRFN